MQSAARTVFDSDLRARQALACTLLQAAVSQGKLANAYLLVGRARADKLAVAKEVAAHLNCLRDGAGSFGSCLAANSATNSGGSGQLCLNCQWIGRGEHPQAWLYVAGQGKSQKIAVEKIRELTEELAKTSSYVRTVIIPEADEVTFHRPAANALLKSIEEPPANCLFFFFADSVEEVLPTIVSRCQVIPLMMPLKIGYWLENPGEQLVGQGSPAAAQGVSHADFQAESQLALKQELESARAAFITAGRRYFAVGGVRAGQSAAFSYARAASDGVELSKQLQELGKKLSDGTDDRLIAERLIDLLVACELELVHEQACVNGRVTRYIATVLAAAEKTKGQIEHYVKPANAIECFSIELHEMRFALLGDLDRAKR